MRCFATSASAASADANRVSASHSSGSPSARTSSTPRSDRSSPARFSARSSPSRGATCRGGGQAQSPSSTARAPESRPLWTSSRKNITFPRLVSQSAWAVAASTGPSSTRREKVGDLDDARAAGARSVRRDRPSTARRSRRVQVRVNGSPRAHGLPSWLRAGGRARPTSGSSAWASSTTSTSGAPPALRTSSARSAPSGFASTGFASTGAGSRSGWKCVNAPSGIDAAERLAKTRSIHAPRRCSSASASRSSRVLPTPGAPATTAPPGSRSVRSSTVSSASRPTSGHDEPARQGGPAVHESHCAASLRPEGNDQTAWFRYVDYFPARTIGGSP